MDVIVACCPMPQAGNDLLPRAGRQRAAQSATWCRMSRIAGWETRIGHVAGCGWRPLGRARSSGAWSSWTVSDAGRKLAAQLLPFAGERPIVIALPRGGVPVAVEVARALDAPLDILAVRKLGAPANPEYGVGAIAEDGTAVLNTETARRVGMTQQVLEATVEREVKELRRRVERYRDGRAADRRAWAHGDRGRRRPRDGPDRPRGGALAARARRHDESSSRSRSAACESVALIGEEADEVVCHTIPHELLGVGHWYRDFSPVSDAEVIAALGVAWERGAEGRDWAHGAGAECERRRARDRCRPRDRRYGTSCCSTSAALRSPATSRSQPRLAVS